MLKIIINPIDKFLNLITMYRLVLYYLIGLFIYASVLTLFNFFSFSFVNLIFSAIFILIICWLFNRIFAKIFNSITNLESIYISALILILIITPAKKIEDYIFLVAACLITVASKFIIENKMKHIFNPAALAVAVTSFLTLGSASWWIGNAIIFPFTLIGGLLLIRKIQRYEMVFAFVSAAFITISFFSFINGYDILITLKKTIFDTPIFFFAFVMLTEPLTAPPTNQLRIIYGIITGVLFSPQLRIAGLYTTPEIALLIGNIFAYFVSPKEKLMLVLERKEKLANDIYDFVFKNNSKFHFIPGQYLEWTLDIKKQDSRGNRRYFTISSSPTESQIRIGVKFYEKSSAFKNKLLNLKTGDKILAGSLAGDFTLQSNNEDKFVFIAGGIGITPFRSMLKYLIDNNIKKDIILLYSNKLKEEIVYVDIFNQAYERLGIKTYYNLTDQENIPQDWHGERGRINSEMIEKLIPDYKERTFYLSGPHAMIMGFEDTLNKLGITKIKKDFFPGFV